MSRDEPQQTVLHAAGLAPPRDACVPRSVRKQLLHLRRLEALLAPPPRLQVAENSYPSTLMWRRTHPSSRCVALLLVTAGWLAGRSLIFANSPPHHQLPAAAATTPLLPRQSSPASTAPAARTPRPSALSSPPAPQQSLPDAGAVPRRPEMECMGSDGEPLATQARSYDLITLILSSQQSGLAPEQRRVAVRRAWARAAGSLGRPAGEARDGRCSVRHFFVLGGARRERLGGGGDLLFLPVADDYRSLSRKVLAAFEWTARSVAFKYLLKTDDDAFVCGARLISLLAPLPRLGLYLGALTANKTVVTSRASPSYERWSDPEYVRIFGSAVYAPYMQGAGYVLSADLVSLAARHPPGPQPLDRSVAQRWPSRPRCTTRPSCPSCRRLKTRSSGDSSRPA